MAESDSIFAKKVMIEPFDSTTLKADQIVSACRPRDENSVLKRRGRETGMC